MNFYLEKGQAYKNRDAQKALVYFFKGKRIADRLQLTKKQSTFLRYIGACYYNLNKSKESLDFYHKALEVARTTEDSLLVSPALYNIALLHIKNNNHKAAFDYLFRSISINRKMNHQVNLGYDYNQLGVLYKKVGNLHKSDSMLSLSLKARNEHHRAGLGYTYINIGNNLFSREKYDSAFLYYQKAKHNLTRYGDLYSSLDAFRLMGNVSWMQGDYQRSREIFSEVQDKSLEIGHIDAAFFALISIGLTEVKLGNRAKAIDFYQQALALGQQHELDPMLMIEVHDKVYHNAKAMGQHRLALAHLERYQELYSDSKKEEFKNKFQLYEEYYKDLNEKYELLELNKKRELAYQQKKLYLTIVIAITMVLSMLLLFLYKMISDKNRSMEVLEQQNSTIIEQKHKLERAHEEVRKLNSSLQEKVSERTQQLADYARRLESQNASLEHYAFINSHKVRGPLARILGLIPLIKAEASASAETRFMLAELLKQSQELDEMIKEANATQ